ncbi:MAG TPA: hypothetical protein VK961_12445 [Chthoniobacter sp.]|nr:hypothetical protein [Chthoniobacter sp.]
MLGVLSLLLFLTSARADEPFFKKNDVIALIGGEDLVVASEYGYLELLLTRALPDYHLRFRSLAWEGDTVYEQRRDLNFPTWEEQLDQIGATVVICQFGQMESLDGQEKLPEFIAAYEKLIERFSAGGKRRVAVALPSSPFQHSSQQFIRWTEFIEALKKMKVPKETWAVNASAPSIYFGSPFYCFLGQKMGDPILPGFYRDGLHLADTGQQIIAIALSNGFVGRKTLPPSTRLVVTKAEQPLLQLIVAKNKLWFDYWRVQNWAFLAGDRTNQPSSRDWRDPSKRWFPAEREEFIPLIEAKEKEIDALAAKLSQK